MEYIIPVIEPFSAVLFYDLGNACSSPEKLSLKNMYTSAGLEIRIFFPRLPLPVRLIFASNNRRLHPEDSRLVFRFAFGTSF